MYKVKLEKMSSNENALRTPTVEGTCRRLPKEGETFEMYAPGLNYGTRVVTTSPVQHNEVCKTSNGLPETHVFMTLNTLYRVEVLGEEDD